MITHTQRVKAALEGKMLDRPAFAAWGPHMNLVDRNAKDFARATIDYQNAHHFDFIKVMPNGMYFPEAFGQKLKDADFIPDVVAIADIPERIYWIVPLSTAEEGGRAVFSTSPFQCGCEDVTSVPIVTGRPNVSLGCFGCRKKTTMAADELACGIPYAMIPGFVDHLKRYGTGVMTKAKRV